MSSSDAKSATATVSDAHAPRRTWKDLFNTKDMTRDAIIGFADGLTVPFALTAGLSSLGSTRIVVVGGLAELFAGAISMSLGAWLAAVSDAQYYACKAAEERSKPRCLASLKDLEVYRMLERYGLAAETVDAVMRDLARDEDRRVEFVLGVGEGLREPDASRAWISALTMGLAYFGGGILPMIPYFAMHRPTHALFVSIGVTVVILLLFGYVKSRMITGSKWQCAKGAVQTLLVGAIAAGASYGIVSAVEASHS